MSAFKARSERGNSDANTGVCLGLLGASDAFALMSPKVCK